MKISDSRRAPQQVKEQERRNSPRLRINPLVYLKVAPDNGGFLLNLSEEGMCISVAKPVVVSSEISFSFDLGEHQLVQGVGHISWLSESGRSAGVQFVRRPGDSLDRIEKWLGIEGPQAHIDRALEAPMEVNPPVVQGQHAGTTPRPVLSSAVGDSGPVETPVAAPNRAITDIQPGLLNRERKAASSLTIFAPPPPRPDAVSSEGSPPVQATAEGNLGPAAPDTLLMYLPRSKASEDVPRDLSVPALTPLSGEQKTTAREDHSEVSDAFRSVIASKSLSVEDEAREGSRVKQILLVTVICIVLIALGVMIRTHPGAFPSIAWLTPAAGTQPALEPVKEAESLGLTGRIRGHRTSMRNERGGQPIAGTHILYGPTRGEARFPVEVTDTFRQHWLATVTSRDMTIREPSGAISVHAARPAPSMSSFVSNLHLDGLMKGVLRDDGALVEEGVRSSETLKADDRAAMPAPVVVEAAVDKDGAVRDVRLISSPVSALAEAVVATVKQWRYVPLYENGQPVEFTTRVTFDFASQRRKP